MVLLSQEVQTHENMDKPTLKERTVEDSSIWILPRKHWQNIAAENTHMVNQMHEYCENMTQVVFWKYLGEPDTSSHQQLDKDSGAIWRHLSVAHLDGCPNVLALGPHHRHALEALIWLPILHWWGTPSNIYIPLPYRPPNMFASLLRAEICQKGTACWMTRSNGWDQIQWVLNVWTRSLVCKFWDYPSATWSMQKGTKITALVYNVDSVLYYCFNSIRQVMLLYRLLAAICDGSVNICQRSDMQRSFSGKFAAIQHTAQMVKHNSLQSS